MIVRFNIDQVGEDQFDYRVSYEGEDLYGDEGLGGLDACIIAATEGLGTEPVGAQIAFKGVISGTYPLATLALASSQLAEHAMNTTAAIEEVYKS